MTSPFDSKKLGNLHGPVLFEIFKFLHSKHLLSSIVLVCSEWRQIVVECVLKLEIKEYNFKTFLQEQLDPFKNDPKASYSCPHLQSYDHVERFVQSSCLFQNLSDFTLAGHNELFSFELYCYLVRQLKNLNKLTLSDVWLHSGRFSRRLRKKDVNVEASTEPKGFFARFKKKKEVKITENEKVEKRITKNDMADIVVEFVRSDIKDGPLKLTSMKESIESLEKLHLFKVKLELENYENIMKQLVCLKELRVVDCYLDKFTLQTKSKQLSHVELNFSNSNFPHLTIETSNNPLIESLSYFVLNNVECGGLCEFLPKCKNLKYLVSRKYLPLKVTENLSIEHLSVDSGSLVWSELHHLLKHSPSLKSLEILNITFISSDISVTQIFEIVPNLDRLAIRNVKGISNTSVSSHQLKYLELSSLEMNPESKIECPSLNTLILNSCSNLLDSSKAYAVMKSGNIRELSLSMLSSSEGIASATALVNLVKLDFSYNRKLTAERLREILSFTPKVEYLNLKMTGISGEFITEPGSKLKTLLLSGSSILNGQLNTLVTHCLELTRLDIDCCNNLTKIDLSCLQKLNSLDLSETTMKVDTILACIEAVPSLRHLYLRWIADQKSSCSKQVLMQKFRNLLFLDVTGSELLTKADFLETITKEFKDLVIVPKTQIFRYETAINPFINYC